MVRKAFSLTTIHISSLASCVVFDTIGYCLCDYRVKSPQKNFTWSIVDGFLSFVYYEFIIQIQINK